MKHLRFLLSFALIAGMIAFTGCEEDDDPGMLSLEAIEGTGTDLETGNEVTKDLNAATAAEDVPLDVTIHVTFSKEVDAATITASTVALSGNGDVSLSLSVDGANVTIDPDQDLGRGTEYTLTLTNGIVAADGGEFESVTRTFTTAGQPQVTPPQEGSQIAYFNFNESIEDQTGNYSVVEANSSYEGFVEDRFGYQNSALQMDGETNILDVENDGNLVNPSTTISFWFKTDLDDEHVANGMFVMGATAEYGFFFEIGLLENGNPWFKVATRHMQHPESANDFGSATAWGDAIKGEGAETGDVWSGDLRAMLDEQWVHFVLSYDHNTGMKRAYMNGTLVWEMNLQEGDEWKMKEMHIDMENATDASNNIGIGFAGSSDNHSTGWADYQTFVDEGTHKTFYGLMDDVRFFSTALSQSEVNTLYNDEKP
ncbi:MAG: Ig-like domain-containing protein [Bacteroidales bacterium]|nr:Ig-like domain-containing protein [Bacteroidales bacterium]MCF8337934.1 Ig-like domain-containing protein [Bacteroidales bacterium]